MDVLLYSKPAAVAVSWYSRPRHRTTIVMANPADRTAAPRFSGQAQERSANKYHPITIF
jgi:hypothetical protein